MSWGEEDKSLEWIVYDTLEKENKKLKGRIKALEVELANMKTIGRPLGWDRLWQRNRELETRIQELEIESLAGRVVKK